MFKLMLQVKDDGLICLKWALVYIKKPTVCLAPFGALAKERSMFASQDSGTLAELCV